MNSKFSRGGAGYKELYSRLNLIFSGNNQIILGKNKQKKELSFTLEGN